MKISIIAATGKSGRYILEEAVARGLDCTAIVRSPAKLTSHVPFISRDVWALTREDMEPFDVIVSAFGNDRSDNREDHVKVIEHYKSLLKDTGKRLITVGAAGHLFTDDRRVKKVYDTWWMRLSGITAGAKVLEQAYVSLTRASGFDWTYMSPAVRFIPDGVLSGRYLMGSDVLARNSDGRSEVSYADYAAALVDEITKQAFVNSICNVCGSDPKVLRRGH